MEDRIKFLKEEYVRVKRFQSWMYWNGYEDQTQRERIKEIERELNDADSPITSEEYRKIDREIARRKQNFEDIQQDTPIL